MNIWIVRTDGGLPLMGHFPEAKSFRLVDTSPEGNTLWEITLSVGKPLDSLEIITCFFFCLQKGYGLIEGK